ncbi:MAG: MBL fold metallo-hydrolase [Gemmatimonadota bacterium]|nr:MBL fold metallo-hydrolase [Gemmatimonadota bacterium]
MRISRASALVPLFLLAGCQPADSPGGDAGPPPGSDFEGTAFEFEEVVPGVYHARGTGALSVGSHGAVIVNEDDVLLVESHISPAAAYAVVEEIEALTGKPVRYVVNTHYHFDHAHGNQIYPDDVHVIGHEVTREMLESGASLGRSYELFVGRLPDQIAVMEGRIEGLQRAVDEAEDEAARAEAAELLAAFESRLAYTRNYAAGQDALVPKGPNTTLSQRMTLFRGDREIRILFFGRGHTGGDVVVHLPQERVIVTGDLLLPGLPYMGDGYLAEWVESLEHVKALDFDWVLPGHGDPFQGKERITYQQDYMRDLQARAAGFHAQGMSYEEAAAQIDMTDHAEHYPQIRFPGVPAVAVQRVFELLDDSLPSTPPTM